MARDPLKTPKYLLVCEHNLEVNNIPPFEVSLTVLTEDQHFYVSKKSLFLNIFNVKPGYNYDYVGGTLSTWLTLKFSVQFP